MSRIRRITRWPPNEQRLGEPEPIMRQADRPAAARPPDGGHRPVSVRRVGTSAASTRATERGHVRDEAGDRGLNRNQAQIASVLDDELPGRCSGRMRAAITTSVLLAGGVGDLVWWAHLYGWAGFWFAVAGLTSGTAFIIATDHR